MAGLEIDFPDDFLSELLNTDFDDMAAEMEKECAPIVKEEIENALAAAVEHDGDSDLLKSIKIKGPKKSKNGAVITNIGPSGTSRNYYYRDKKKKRKHYVSNALKAIWLEYGRAGQAARPWLATATKNSENKVLKKMQEIYDKKVGVKNGH